MSSTFELGGLQELLPLGADLLHAGSHLSGGIVLPVQQLLAGLLQGVDAALVGRELGLEGLVLLHLALQVGGVLWLRERREREGGGILKGHSLLLIFANYTFRIEVQSRAT